MNDDPVTGKIITVTIIKGLRWLDLQIQMIVGPAQAAPTASPADVTDVQLHEAIHDVAATLLNKHGPLLQDSFAHCGTTLSDPRFPAAMPVLGSPKWKALTGQIRAKLEPLTQETQ